MSEEVTWTDGGSGDAAEPAADGTVAGSVLADVVGEALTRGFAGRMKPYVVPRAALRFAVRPPAGVACGAVQGTTPHSVIMALGDFGKMKITPLASTMNPAPAPSPVYHGCLVAASNRRRQIAASNQRRLAGSWRNRRWSGSSGNRHWSGSWGNRRWPGSSENPRPVGSVRNRCWSGSCGNPYLGGPPISRC